MSFSLGMWRRRLYRGRYRARNVRPLICFTHDASVFDIRQCQVRHRCFVATRAHKLLLSVATATVYLLTVSIPRLPKRRTYLTIEQVIELASKKKLINKRQRFSEDAWTAALSSNSSFHDAMEWFLWIDFLIATFLAENYKISRPYIRWHSVPEATWSCASSYVHIHVWQPRCLQKRVHELKEQHEGT